MRRSYCYLRRTPSILFLVNLFLQDITVQFLIKESPTWTISATIAQNLDLWTVTAMIT